MSMFYELMMKKKGMPSRYQEVEYIESTGTQYIDTGILGNSLYNYEIEYQCVNSGDRVFLCGVDESFDLKSSIFVRLTNGNFSWYYDTGGIVLFNNSNYNTAKNKLEVLYDTNSNTVTANVYNNDTKIGTGQRNIANIYNGNFYLGAINRNGGVAFDGTKRFYSAKFYNGTKLIRNFIPVYDTETQKYGMWESVQGKFYGNDGTGDFKGSIVGYTIVGSPTITDGVVSGFSSANYLKIDKTITADKIEISVLFSLSSVGWNDIFLGKSSAQTNLLAETNSAGNLNLYFAQGFSGSNIFVSALLINTNYRLDLIITYDNIEYKLINEDTNTIIAQNTRERTTKATPYLDIPAFGKSAPNITIAIKDTIIKANNKLWFNGQQA